MNFNGGTLQYAGLGNNGSADITQTSLGVVRSVTIGANGATIDTNSNDVAYANAIGNNGAGWLVKTGTGKLTLNGANAYTGGTRVRAGTLEINNATSTSGLLTTDGVNLEIAVAAGDTANVNLKAGTINADRVMVGGNSSNNDGGTGTLTQTGGTINARRWLTVGPVGNGKFDFSGGTINQNLAGNTHLEIATFGTSQGVMNLSGTARLNLLNNANLVLGAVNTTGNGTVNQNGGNVTFYADGGAIGAATGGAAGIGTVGGTGLVVLGQGNSSGTYTYNLNGGTLTTGGIARVADNAKANFNFNGGLLKATRDNGDFLRNLMTVTVGAGGARLDTGGHDVTLYQPLRGSAGDGGLTKSGVGTLTLRRASTFTGKTIVTQGTLTLADTGTISGDLTLGSAAGTSAAGTTATLDVKAKPSFVTGNLAGSGVIDLGVGKTLVISGTLAPGFSAGKLSVAGDVALGTVTLMELAGTGGNKGVDSDLLAASGNLAYAGTLAVTGSGNFDPATPGTYDLFDAMTFTGNFASVTVGGTPLADTGGLWIGTLGTTPVRFASSTGLLTIGTTVLEPTTLGILALSGFSLLVRRRN